MSNTNTGKGAEPNTQLQAAGNIRFHGNPSTQIKMPEFTCLSPFFSIFAIGQGEEPFPRHFVKEALCSSCK